jgi:hypothetical protein
LPCEPDETVVTAIASLHTYQVTGWELERKLISQNGCTFNVPGMGLLKKIKLRFVAVNTRCT